MLPTALVILGVVCPAEAGAEPKVRQLYVSVSVYQNVVRLDVSVDEAHLMDALQSAGELGDVKLSQLLLEDAEPDEEAHHVPAGNVLHDEVQVVLVLEGVVETHHPLVVGFGQDVPLGLYVRHLVPQQHVLLAESLHGVQRPRVLLPRQGNFSEGADAERLDPFEHGLVHFGSLQADVVGLLLREHHSHLLLGV